MPRRAKSDFLSVDTWVNVKVWGITVIQILLFVCTGFVLYRFLPQEPAESLPQDVGPSTPPPATKDEKTMFYALIGEDVPGTLDKRLAARSDHLARLQQLKDQGRLLLAGPFPSVDSNDPGPAGFTGSLIVAEFASLADAQAFAVSDPYVAAGVYANVTVKPFKKVLP